MASYYRAYVADFLSTSRSELLAQLTLRHANDGFTQIMAEVPRTWWEELGTLQEMLRSVSDSRAEVNRWHILLEFTIPRKLFRIDVVLLGPGIVVLLECKTGNVGVDAARQAEQYALLLHYFHEQSTDRRLWPFVVSSALHGLEPTPQQYASLAQSELDFPTLPAYWIKPVTVCSWAQLASLLASLPINGEVIDGTLWDDAPYCPTPTIIEAACALRSGLSIREIAMSEAAEHDIAAVTEEIRTIVQGAQTERQHTLCFLTGVPGSGKTLVGLSLAHLSESRSESIHFMSGNGPLVQVLQEFFRREAMREGDAAENAKVRAQTLIENVHVFAKNYTERDPSRAPSNHVIIFDEAQRAWDRQQNLRKFKRDYSEPEMLLKIMERHTDYACVVALVGGGQEINNGEAGLEEWGKAILEAAKPWSVFASPEVITGGASTAGHRLFAAEGEHKARISTRDLLHLRTSNRSLRAENLAQWVNLVLAGDAAAARALRIGDKFPLFLTRNLGDLRRELRRVTHGESRCGLVASSGAARLRAEGLEPGSSFHAEYPWHHWYLAPATDIRSSFQCEVFATEFEVQGLELDWVGLCWGGDFIRNSDAWSVRDLRYGPVTKWSPTKRSDRIKYRTNAYRVLLTRSRQGMIIFVPRGDSGDSTRSPAEFDQTAAFLLTCGVRELLRPRAEDATKVGLTREQPTYAR